MQFDRSFVKTICKVLLERAVSQESSRKLQLNIVAYIILNAPSLSLTKFTRGSSS